MKPPLLVVDGYNLLFQFTGMGKISRDQPFELQRNDLIRQVQDY